MYVCVYIVRLHVRLDETVECVLHQLQKHKISKRNFKNQCIVCCVPVLTNGYTLLQCCVHVCRLSSRGSLTIANCLIYLNSSQCMCVLLTARMHSAICKIVSIISCTQIQFNCIYIYIQHISKTEETTKPLKSRMCVHVSVCIGNGPRFTAAAAALPFCVFVMLLPFYTTLHTLVHYSISSSSPVAINNAINNLIIPSQLCRLPKSYILAYVLRVLCI